MIFSRPRVVLTLLTFLLVLAFPAAASAAFIVNSTADEPDAVAGAPCESAAGKCTLRAAIEVTNGAGVADNILFDAALFDGQLADTIALTSPLPGIKAPVSINAGTCAPLPNPKPCAGVSGPTGNFGISVEADGVTISGLAVTGALTGISVINESANFTARGNWVGVKLDGSEGANNTGIFIDPGSDGATIGGPEVVQRNVIAGNNLEGLDIQGASDAVIRGNYFGVAPDGLTQMGNAKNIEITDSTSGGGDAAEDNEIGAKVEGAALGSAACDGGCNVISGATGTGIDLDGQDGSNEAPATGPTIVRGNYVGLRAAGTAAIPNGTFAILAGGAEDVTVGGFESGELNRITGGGFGVYGENGDDLSVLGNVIGLDVGASPASPPATGVFVQSLEISGPEAGARIASNTIYPSGRGIEQRFTGAEITNNFISGGETGIYTVGSSVGEGNLIAENRVQEVGGNGILVENDSNVVIANEVKEAGEAGILVKYVGLIPTISESTGNRIGGDEEFEENEILGSGGPAIEIRNLEKTNNEVARNHGEGNKGLFIDLVKAELIEPNTPNEGIQPPALSALASSASGTAQPGATVRVFRKASAEAGELESFLGEATADGSGNWKVNYASALPVGTIVAATQTNVNGGTSELATATSSAA
ncbi:MAG: right-handed parallel beta-helix repeat-containing protein, partial [Actinomycetota bacterium]|nr:right-handed parallel beta-helix repeat-containing protein [Actinomycetota bacterium]